MPLHTAVPLPATDARKSNAQSGSLNATLLAAPAAGAADSDCQLSVPVRRIESDDSPAPVALMTVKPEAPAKAGAGVKARAAAASAKAGLIMASI
jgi:hypothetical protein